jgi:hypothetical protein
MIPEKKKKNSISSLKKKKNRCQKRQPSSFTTPHPQHHLPTPHLPAPTPAPTLNPTSRPIVRFPMLAIFDEELATTILEEVDKAAAQPSAKMD